MYISLAPLVIGWINDRLFGGVHLDLEKSGLIMIRPEPGFYFIRSFVRSFDLW